MQPTVSVRKEGLVIIGSVNYDLVFEGVMKKMDIAI